MTKILIDCKGVSAAGLWIPPFQLRLGEWLCLHMPTRFAFSGKEHELLRVLMGQHLSSGFDVRGKIIWAQRLVGPGGWLAFLKSRRVVDWLRTNGALTREEAIRVAKQFGLCGHCLTSQVDGTLRVRLGLEAAWARGAEAVIFSTCGLDPLGMQATCDAVAARLERCAALRLSYPFTQDGELRRACYPGGMCLELDQPSQILAASSTNRI